MQPVVSFGRVFFGLWNRFFLCALHPKEQQEETALFTVFPLALRGYG